MRAPFIAPSFRPEALAWKAAALANGGSVSRDTLVAVDRLLVRSLLAAGLWQKSYMIDPCAGSDLTAALTRLKVPSGVSRSYTNVNFVSGDYSETAGLTGNGSTKRLNSGINPLALGWDETNLMLWAYLRSSNPPAASAFAMGCSSDNVTKSLMLYYRGTNQREVVGVGAYQGGNTAPAGASGPLLGLSGGGTNGTKEQQFYHNGAPSGSPVVATSTLPNRELFKFAHNNAGTPELFSSRTLTSALITQGLSGAEAATLYAIVQTFESALGRAV